MKKKPIISVIIPCYNCEKYISRCIDSILKQKYDNYEIVAVNDGSKDNTYKILNDFSKKNSKIRVITQKNQGGVVARNNGIIEAKGTYIYLMDSDDWIEDDTFSIIIDYLENNNYPDMIKFRYYSEPGKIESEKLFYDSKIKLIKKDEFKYIWNLLLYTDLYNSIWNCLFKKELFDFSSPVYKHVVHKGEDLQINLQLIDNSSSVLLVNNCLYHYITNPTGITQYVNKQKLITNCFDRLYLTKLKCKMYKKKYGNYNNNIVVNSYASLIMSQIVKLLKNKSTTKEDLVDIQNHFEKNGIIDYIRNIDIKNIKYRGSNFIYSLILNRMLLNLIHLNNSKNYKYRHLFNLYYKLNK